MKTYDPSDFGKDPVYGAILDAFGPMPPAKPKTFRELRVEAEPLLGKVRNPRQEIWKRILRLERARLLRRERSQQRNGEIHWMLDYDRLYGGTARASHLDLLPKLGDEPGKGIYAKGAGARIVLHGIPRKSPLMRESGSAAESYYGAMKALVNLDRAAEGVAEAVLPGYAAIRLRMNELDDKILRVSSELEFKYHPEEAERRRRSPDTIDLTDEEDLVTNPEKWKEYRAKARGFLNAEYAMMNDKKLRPLLVESQRLEWELNRMAFGISILMPRRVWLWPGPKAIEVEKRLHSKWLRRQ